MSMEGYKPSVKEVSKAEKMMNDEQWNASQQREKEVGLAERIKDLGSQLHEEWRKPRYREASKDYEPRVKKTKDEAWSQAHGGAVEVDIANTPYEELPSEWQGENKISAEVAVNEVEKAREAGQPLDESFVEAASSTLHDKWLERNGSWAPPEQNIPYAELSEEEKEKDRVIIRKAVALTLEGIKRSNEEIEGKEHQEFVEWRDGLKNQSLSSLEDQADYIAGRVTGARADALHAEIKRRKEEK